jgi:hypothetical protein
VLHWRPVGVAVHVGQRKHGGLADAGGVEQRNQAIAVDRRHRRRRAGHDGGAEEMLMMIGAGTLAARRAWHGESERRDQ